MNNNLNLCFKDIITLNPVYFKSLEGKITIDDAINLIDDYDNYHLIIFKKCLYNIFCKVSKYKKYRRNAELNTLFQEACLSVLESLKKYVANNRTILTNLSSYIDLRLRRYLIAKTTSDFDIVVPEGTFLKNLKNKEKKKKFEKFQKTSSYIEITNDYYDPKDDFETKMNDKIYIQNVHEILRYYITLMPVKKNEKQAMFECFSVSGSKINEILEKYNISRTRYDSLRSSVRSKVQKKCAYV